ncbi:ROK family protein [Mucilaginibacter sp.]|uniref:ROK family protein n=1 Tax=Mucilaginibacter sp. TaxID=1882438 RepID=UPI00283EBD02|nr:ROK family protein [Mucilaginibacter sp.]MDR3696482.1 ROK family protein [Mucilaginibacter sp.]
MSCLIGIDIGGTKCSISLGAVDNDKLLIIDKLTFPTEKDNGYMLVIQKMYDSIDTMLDQHSVQLGQMSAIGISCGGPLDSKNGIIMSPPNLPGWDNVPVVELFQVKYGVPVGLQNDANACALAEWQYGAGKGLQNMIFLTFGTGLGAGLILNGKLYTGTNDMAGEVGHIRLDNYGPVGYGKAGSFEGFCSGGGIAQLAKIKVMEQWQIGNAVSFCANQRELDNINAAIIAEAAKNGDALAIAIYKTSGTYLGKGLSALIDILNPEAIIIGSIFTRDKELLWDSCKNIVAQEALHCPGNTCKILPAALGEDIGSFAALTIAATCLQLPGHNRTQ